MSTEPEANPGWLLTDCLLKSCLLKLLDEEHDNLLLGAWRSARPSLSAPSEMSLRVSCLILFQSGGENFGGRC